MRLFSKRAQTTAEYAILIGLVVGALVAIQTYVKRGVQGRFKDASDEYVLKLRDDANWGQIRGTGPDVTATALPQYEFDMVTGKATRETQAGTGSQETMGKGGTITRENTQISQQAEGDYRHTDYSYDGPNPD